MALIAYNVVSLFCDRSNIFDVIIFTLDVILLQILKENTVLSFWKYLNNGEKAFGIIAFVNVIIYLAWNVTKWNSTMFKYFIVNEGKFYRAIANSYSSSHIL